jgi:hypothetical protein
MDRRNLVSSTTALPGHQARPASCAPERERTRACGPAWRRTTRAWTTSVSTSSSRDPSGGSNHGRAAARRCCRKPARIAKLEDRHESLCASFVSFVRFVVWSVIAGYNYQLIVMANRRHAPPGSQARPASCPRAPTAITVERLARRCLNRLQKRNPAFTHLHPQKPQW